MVLADAQTKWKAQIVFWRRFIEWLSELLALGLLPWLAKLVITGGAVSERAGERPELYLFVMVISVTSLFEVTKDKATINVMKPLACISGILGAVLGPVAYARLSNLTPAGTPEPAVNQFLQAWVLGIIVVSLGVYGLYRVPLIWGQAKGEAEALVRADTAARETKP